MANIVKIKNKKGISYKVQIRHVGYKPIYKTFKGNNALQNAKKWIKIIEGKFADGTYKEEVSISKTKKLESEITSDEELMLFRRKNISTVHDLIFFFRTYIAPYRYADPKKNDCMYDWWDEHLKDFKVVNLSASDLSACKQILLTEKYEKDKIRKANTINKYLMCFSAVLRFAVKELEIIEYNPMSKVDIVPKPEGRKRYLDIEEIAAYLLACKNYSPMIYLFALIALGTGGRYSEVQQLKVENIDYNNERVYYLDTKNKTSRGVYLEPYVLDLIKQYCKENNIESGYIFKGKRGNSLAFIRGTLYKIIKDVKLDDFTVHDMRHTFASYHAMNGATLLEIAELLGQKSLSVARRYSHLAQKHTDALVKRIVKAYIPKI